MPERPSLIKEALKETYPKDKAMRDNLELQYLQALTTIEWIELRIGLHNLTREEWVKEYLNKDKMNDTLKSAKEQEKK